MRSAGFSFRILFLVFFFLFALGEQHLFGQIRETGALKTGIGITGFTQENVITPSILLAYEKDFLPRTFVEISTEYAFPVNADTDRVKCKLSSYRFGMNIFFKALEERNQTFSAGLGLSAGLYQSEKTSIQSTEYESRTDFDPGFSILVEYDYILASNWFFGARAGAFRYDADRSAWMLGATTGLRF